jgi:hypothetical protein
MESGVQRRVSGFTFQGFRVGERSGVCLSWNVKLET